MEFSVSKVDPYTTGTAVGNMTGVQSQCAACKGDVARSIGFFSPIGNNNINDF